MKPSSRDRPLSQAWPVALAVLVVLLLVVGFGGGNWLAVVAVVLIAAVCWAAGLLVGRDSVTAKQGEETAQLRADLTWHKDLAKSRQVHVVDLRAAIKSLEARNEMLVGLLGGEQNIPSAGGRD